jgi:hypothetical protein
VEPNGRSLAVLRSEGVEVVLMGPCVGAPDVFGF